MNVYGNFTENLKLFLTWLFLKMTQDKWAEKTSLLNSGVILSWRECCDPDKEKFSALQVTTSDCFGNI